GLAVWVQPLAQILAAFPANLLFPFLVAFIVRFDLSADVWLSPLMVLGPQWSILFNVIAGASAIPFDLRDIAAAVLAAWDDEANRETDVIGALDGPMEALRALLAAKPARAPREPGAQRKPREGTKQDTVLAMLRREEGATIAQICEATGWQQHTVRGFCAGLRKRQGIEVKALERIRKVGPNKEGAKGTFTIYRVD
ncbi:MAG: DUF3489 domain-containing protein, partial [Elioraea sp.]|nr:DUF3489 domain-containing protein [Elioraea sp.]